MMPHRYNEVTLHRANCNGVEITMQKCWATTEPEEDAYFLVSIVDRYDEESWGDDPYDYETEAEAKVAFDGFVEEYRDKPNWNAQAAYDKAHGTINGQDPRIAEWNELVGEY